MIKQHYLIILVFLLFLGGKTLPSCTDGYNMPPGWYYIRINVGNSHNLALTVQNPVSSNGWQFPYFTDASYPSLNQVFYIQSNGNIRSNLGSQSIMSNSGIRNPGDWSYAYFGDRDYLLTSLSPYSFQSCNNGTYRIYTVYNGNRAYLGITPGGASSYQAWFGGSDYWASG